VCLGCERGGFIGWVSLGGERGGWAGEQGELRVWGRGERCAGGAGLKMGRRRGGVWNVVGDEGDEVWGGG